MRAEQAPLMDKPTWFNTLDIKPDVEVASVREMREIAYGLGYIYFVWGGSIFQSDQQITSTSYIRIGESILLR